MNGIGLSAELKFRGTNVTLNSAAVLNYKGGTAVDYQSPGRCCNIPSVINKMIHNAAHGAAFMIHSFMEVLLYWSIYYGKWWEMYTHTQIHIYTQKQKNHTLVHNCRQSTLLSYLLFTVSVGALFSSNKTIAKFSWVKHLWFLDTYLPL